MAADRRKGRQGDDSLQLVFEPLFKLAARPPVNGQVKVTAEKLDILLIEAREALKALSLTHPNKDRVDSLLVVVDWMRIQLQRGPPGDRRSHVRRVTAELRRRQRAFAGPS